MALMSVANSWVLPEHHSFNSCTLYERAPGAQRYASATIELVDERVGGSIVNAHHIAQTASAGVYRLNSARFGRPVAIKVIDKYSVSRKYADSFLKREILISRLVVNPFICRTLDVFCPNERTVVLILEYCAGNTLLDLTLQRRNISVRSKVILFRQLAEAIQWIHNMNIVHRDIKESGLKALYILLQIIKMENCLLCEYGNVKLADFGFARHMQSRLERSTSFCGTKPYSSPDLVRQRPYDCYSNDWYSAGVILYTLLSGKWPFHVERLNHAPWPTVVYPSNMFSSEAAELLRRLLNENAYMRADYTICVKSKFLSMHGQGERDVPFVRGPSSSLFNQPDSKNIS